MYAGSMALLLRLGLGVLILGQIAVTPGIAVELGYNIQQCEVPVTKIPCSRDSLPIMQHGSVQQIIDHQGTTMLLFQCDPGYAMAGEATAPCQCGYYARSFPKCVIKDCLQHYNNGHRKNGVYGIAPDGHRSVSVLCDMTTRQGGWTVIQRRVNGSTNFDRGWEDYKNGFGDVLTNYWIGLENLHHLTKDFSELRIDMVYANQGQRKYAQYEFVEVSDGTGKYRFRTWGYHGNAYDSLSKEKGMMFSTCDSENDISVDENCARKYHSGWWYGDCYSSHLNGVYGWEGTWGVKWYGSHLSYVEMKVRRTT